MTAHMHSMLSKLQKMRLMAKTRRRGAHKGGRTANKFGTSLEFSDFRLYQPGDDVRQIDWNIYGRTQKHYIKRFLDEQELAVTIFLDASSSMQAIDSKWNRAKELTAAFSYITLTGEDRLSFIPVSSASYAKVSRKGSVYSKHVFFEILQLPKQEAAGTFTDNFQKNTLKNNQLVILITDGLEPLESFEALFRLIAAAKQEVKLIQLLSREELEPIYSGDLKLIDSESNESVNVTMNESTLVKYQKQVQEHNFMLEALCRRFGFSYLLTTDDADLKNFLFLECSAKRMLY
ncbi:hypothetical protein BACCIP111895_00418 [Neobacillus rhizosphaerae]|uniref:DUF58 domain-containing protein n=1 Tax=Neobacillus rhizosphaerae TaxID=2880965 RepID=A0ABN8KIM4_9BACI|nr:DUF58 domain-containing protein [Neobacillus rhizosphaerae]CAH2713283.1 hypothetical protein BACCIP111895_00418 [Neobacillus rhizosphaerae]